MLEITWSVIPFAHHDGASSSGARSVFFAMSRPPAETLNIYVVGKQWMWKFQHLDGQREINELHVPVGRPVKLIMTSEDVIHNFFVPAFRVKADVIPAATRTSGSSRPRPARYHLFCAEYCGTKHSGMIGKVVVMEPDDYQAWLSGGGAGRVARRRPASEAVRAISRCNTCHRRRRAGPRARRSRACSARRSTLADGGTRRRRRGLHPRVDPDAGGEGRRRLPADHADVPGAGQRGGAAAADRVHQVARQASAPRGAPTHSQERDHVQQHGPACRRDHYLNDGYGVKSWLLTRDHKRIALLYLVAVTFFFFIGGAFAVLIRLELTTPAGDLVSRRDLQQAVHDARRDDGVLLPHPGHPGGARQLPGADDDRRARTSRSRS